MMLDYFYGQSGELFAYFRIPKALFQDSRFRQLSTDARTLYGILLDRMSLSAKNSWVDEHGRVYIIYTVREVQESLCCAEHKAVKLFRELEQADLIERKRRGLGRPSLIYVKNFSSGLPKAQIQNCANSNSCAAESAVQVRPKSQSNKTDRLKQLLEAIHVIGDGNAVGTNRSVRVENTAVVLILGNVNSNTNHFDTSGVFISMLFRTTDFFALVTSF